MQNRPSSTFAAKVGTGYRRKGALSDDDVMIPGSGIAGIDSGTQTNQSGEEDVHITFGIQDSIERVWHAALEKVGSLSLAWQSEAAQARMTTAADVNPELVFDNVRKAAFLVESKSGALQGGLAPADPDMQLDAEQQPRLRLHRPPRRSRAVVRPRSITQLSNGSSRHTVRSDEHHGLHSLQLAGHRENILRELAQDGGFSDHAAETRRIRSRRLARGQRKHAPGRAVRPKKPAVLKVQPISEGLVAEAILPVAVPAQVSAGVLLKSARSQRDKRRNRASIRLERLLPPKAPVLSQASGFAGKPRSISLPCGSAMDSSQDLALPVALARQRMFVGIDSLGKRGDYQNRDEVEKVPGFNHRRTNSLPSARDELCGYTRTLSGSFTHSTKHPSGPLDGEIAATNSSPIRSDRCLSSLEERVSGMFTELGLKSPYLDAAHVESGCARGQHLTPIRGKSACNGKVSSRESSVHRKQRTMDTVPWFYQKQYIATDVHHGSAERDVILIDDDSSCADFAADADCHCCSHVCAAKNLGDGFYGASRFPPRRLTGVSGLSTADGSSASTAFDYSQHRLLFSPRSQVHGRLNTPNIGGGYPHSARSNVQTKKNCESFSASPLVFAGECRSCYDQRRPCSQMHNILARIEQTDHYIYSVSQNASAIDSLLADLRAQSRALAETLSISQTRASALGHTVTQAIHKNARNAVFSHEEADSVSSIRGGSAHSEQGHLKDYHALSKKTHGLKKRALALGVQNWAGIAGVETRHVASASESEYEMYSSSRRALLNSPVKGLSKPPKHVHPAKISTRERRGSNSRSRRPEQPISVRVRRIDNQWAELQGVIKQLGLDNADFAAAVSASQDSSGDAEMSAIATDGLKLIQRVLKTTLESLSSASQKRVNDV
ncbi:hypothetical protein GGF40_003733 [Coemansia sp. RSA 1286]|nr:hypothetical protein GGF40_003733 [Coemansia sp. RSA 1286]